MFGRCGPRAVLTCHPHSAWHGHAFAAQCWGDPSEEVDDESFGGGAFGVRRPMRFLAHKLQLDERQVAELARILDELKTERAQAEVDRRRTLTAFADALSGDAFDAAKAGEGGELRLKSAERLREAVLKALQRIHALLNAEQRLRLAYLIRTGTLAV
jgi:Spy/CpxP family protein refolding chaperone